MIGIMVMILIALIGAIYALIKVIYRHKRKLRAQYEIIWTNSVTLQPQDALGLRGKPDYGFRTYYYERPMDWDH